jgi:aspartate aminotransferase
VVPHFLDPRLSDGSHSKLAQGLTGSEILKIAADIRAMVADGHEVCNLTVGDFDPAWFRPPEDLVAGVSRALAAGHTNYPPRMASPNCDALSWGTTNENSAFVIRSSRC